MNVPTLKIQDFFCAVIIALLASVSATVASPVSITYVGTTTGSQMPGAANDFIFFNAGNYPQGGPSTNNGTVYSQLSSFSFAGGVAGQGVPNGQTYATITTPAGNSVQTGLIGATNDKLAFAIVPTGNSNFNYNNFNVYYMVSNTDGGNTDTSVGLDPVTSDNNPAAGNYGTVATESAPVVDNTTAAFNLAGVGPNLAEFVEFNVQGFGADILAHPGGVLVASATQIPNNNAAVKYIGAVSFQSVDVPEPTTYAMLFGGLGMLVVISRLRTKLTT